GLGARAGRLARRGGAPALDPPRARGAPHPAAVGAWRPCTGARPRLSPAQVFAPARLSPHRNQFSGWPGRRREEFGVKLKGILLIIAVATAALALWPAGAGAANL